ncbi:hypothetical protein RHMOL_Rhmol02G0175600 [Rhododendron molle]|nr:hypothetical protein RHMOL_Rhmol02G0175600 [Rhododendron molle]
MERLALVPAVAIVGRSCSCLTTWCCFRGSLGLLVSVFLTVGGRGCLVVKFGGGGCAICGRRRQLLG